jgi:hypothetical protein
MSHNVGVRQTKTRWKGDLIVRWLKQEAYRLGSNDLWMAIAASIVAVLMVVMAAEAQAWNLY